MKEIQTTRKLPKIDDLYKDVELAYSNNELNKLLNSEPKADWIKTNKYANNTKYVPIGIIEYLLTSIYTKWRVEVKSVQVIANSVVVTVRLFVLDPITGEWDWQDGVGASPIQTKSGAAATDFSQVNTAAVQMAAPAAETYAIKDAAEKLGKIFGKDLNRKDEMNYQPMMEAKFENGAISAELVAVIKETTDKQKLGEIYRANPELHTNPRFIQLLNQRKLQLNGTVHA